MCALSGPIDAVSEASSGQLSSQSQESEHPEAGDPPPERHPIRAPWRLWWEEHPARIVTGGYLLYSVVGWLLLCLPWAVTHQGLDALDHLFTAVSALSTTGLATLSTADDYSFLGQLVILGLIQIGGIGYMTLGSFVVLSRFHTLPPARALIGRAVFTLPRSFHVAEFIRGVVLFTLVVEILGAVALYQVFLQAGAPHPVWQAVFHSVSAFCTAGFSLFNNSFEDYARNTSLNLIIGILSYLGAIGFIVCLDYWRLWTGRHRHLTMTSKVILQASFLLLAVGTLTCFVIEPTLAALPQHERFLAAAFQTLTAMTTVGFNTVPIGLLSHGFLMTLIVLMVIGASPAGTGGGLKTTTISAILGVMASALRGEESVSFWGHAIPVGRVLLATANLGFYVGTLLLGIWLLTLTESQTALEPLIFEATSALGTVGLSMGVTATLTPLGKLVIIGLMFAGRVGPLTLGAALAGGRAEIKEPEDDDLAV